MKHLCVSNWGQRVADGSSLGGHREQGGHPKRYPCWYCLEIPLLSYFTVFGVHKILRNLGVNPEGEPGDDDEHAGGDVDGEHVVGKFSPQSQLHQQATVFTCLIIFLLIDLITAVIILINCCTSNYKHLPFTPTISFSKNKK